LRTNRKKKPDKNTQKTGGPSNDYQKVNLIKTARNGGNDQTHFPGENGRKGAGHVNLSTGLGDGKNQGAENINVD